MGRMTILHFPTQKTRPGLVPTLAMLVMEAKLDCTRGLWASHNSESSDCLTPDILLEGIPDQLSTHPFLSLVHIAKEFSLLGLLAVHTGQWVRPDLLSALMTLQSLAERQQKTPLKTKKS